MSIAFMYIGLMTFLIGWGLYNVVKEMSDILRFRRNK